MAARSANEIPVARRVAMTWVSVTLVAAVLAGLVGPLVLDQALAGAESETVFILMSVRLLHPALTGVCMAAIVVAVMSTASAQLLVASAALTGDLYRGLWRRASGSYCG
ncbi:MAG: hypothetical protein JW751_03430 [Polyangiaceae bacterium]|nr:hypothetical protein [Polyangiaceae bacterium]